MSDLLDLVLRAHGGLSRWQAATVIHAKGAVGGLLWTLVGQEGILADADMTVDVHRQRLVFTGFTRPQLRGVFTPDHVEILGPNGAVVAARSTPRDAFAGLGEGDPWDELHVLYFAGYALWNYLTAPYLLTRPGVHVTELEPWRGADQDWRRLRAQFPAEVATHCTEQDFYYDQAGLLRRHDYAPDVLGGTPAAHLVERHITASGLVFPTHRYIVPVDQDGQAASEPVLISIDLDEVHVA
ncbi:hypothetical protein P3T36_007686 [Kitasatospora sp. MAP12-15]|uniref:hypothetical protein n=1 Tax=unclassified Kitasatospora TaxID=2633591 RepID=UPI0024745766|nr:hypothetical protein [Kitasatospora sp. MAP12-44]MDH6115564.1 hypothetical protein [Kitasatospora sp. MAP12-44]